jgi:hypothetical protein
VFLLGITDGTRDDDVSWCTTKEGNEIVCMMREGRTKGNMKREHESQTSQRRVKGNEEKKELDVIC